jgi:signal transduction histidine kinase
MIGGEILSPRQREALDHVSITSDLLEDALKPLLDFSRVESGSIEFSRQPFALQPLLNKLERELSPRAEAKGVEYRSRESDLVLNSSRLFIEMILHNLVLNSIRHTEKGDVLVACRKRKKMAILEVWDTRPHFSQLSDTAQYRVLALGIPQSLLKNSGKLELGIAEALILKMGIECQVKDFPKLGHLVRFSVPLDIDG